MASQQLNALYCRNNTCTTAPIVAGRVTCEAQEVGQGFGLRQQTELVQQKPHLVVQGGAHALLQHQIQQQPEQRQSCSCFVRLIEDKHPLAALTDGLQGREPAVGCVEAANEQAAEHGAYLAEYTQPLGSAVPDKIPGGRKVSGVPLYQFLPAAVGSGAGPFLCKDRCAGEKLAQLCVGDRDVVGAAEIPHEACRLVEDLLRCLREEDLGSLFLLFGKQSTGDLPQGQIRRIRDIQLPEDVPAAGGVGGRDRNHRVAGAAAAQHIRLGRKDDDGVLHAVCVGQHGAADLFHQGGLAAAHIAHQHGGVLPAAAVVQRQAAGQAHHRLHTPRRGWDRSLQLLSFQKTFHRLCPFVSGVSVLHSEKGSAAVPGWKNGAKKILKKQKDLFCRIYAVQKRSFCCVPLRGVS